MERRNWKEERNNSMKKKPLISYLRLLKMEKHTGDITPEPKILEEQVFFTTQNAEKHKSHLLTSVSGLFYDSRKCQKNGFFFCKGRHFLTEFLAEALQKGAIAVVYDSTLFELINSFSSQFQNCIFIEVKNVRKAMASLAAFHFDYPMQKAVTVAVTGTKGKTGTVAAICNCINENPHFKAITLNDALPDGCPTLTTPEPIDFHYAAGECIKRGATHIICEISSQGIKEHRTHGIIFDIACFLNFGSDHISPEEHPTLDDYFNSKTSLFNYCKRAVISLDTERAEEIIGIANDSKSILSHPKSGKKDIFTFSLKDKTADCFGRITEEDESGSLVWFTEKFKDRAIKNTFSSEGVPIPQSNKTKSNPHLSSFFIPHPGKFNVQNSLAAFSVCRLLGCTESEIFRGILSTSVPGRMEIFNTADGRVRVIVDYAHNKMSFEGLFNAAKQIYAPRPCPKITAIFGCSGEKAFGRRYDLPEVALRHSERIIICEDDSGRESFERIKKEILLNAEKILSNEDKGYMKSAKISVIRDRERAISTALKNAYENGEERLILFMGKGREKTMITDSGAVPILDDVSATLNAIKDYDSRLSLNTVFSKLSDSKGRLVTVSLEDSVRVIENFSADASEFLKSGVTLIAVCSSKAFKTLKDSCFKNGIVCYSSEYKRHPLPTSTYSPPEIKAAARSASERGAVYILTVKSDIKKAASEISVREKADALVYLTHSGGIIFNGKKLPSRLSEKSAAAVCERINSPYLKASLEAIRGGVNTVAVIDGCRENALALYGAASTYNGTVIKKL